MPDSKENEGRTIPSLIKDCIRTFLRGQAHYTLGRILGSKAPLDTMVDVLLELQLVFGVRAYEDSIKALCGGSSCSGEVAKCGLGDECPAAPVRTLLEHHNAAHEYTAKAAKAESPTAPAKPGPEKG